MPFSSQVWEKQHFDFMGSFLNKQFLIIIDAFSKWIKAFLLNSISVKVAIEIIRTIIARVA